jgi:hypothetical protein
MTTLTLEADPIVSTIEITDTHLIAELTLKVYWLAAKVGRVSDRSIGGWHGVLDRIMS